MTRPTRSSTARRLAAATGIAVLLAFAAPLIAPAFADPPSWAPAWGYRNNKGKNKNKGHDYDEYERVQVYGQAPIDLQSGRCNRDVVGAIIGGITGGVIGSQIGDGSGRTAATVGGVILGIIVGGSIGRSMDEVDQNCVGQTLEHAPDQRTVAWQNPDDGVDYQVTPTSTYQNTQGQYCREYVTESTIGGETQQTYGTACRQPDGSWKLMN